MIELGHHDGKYLPICKYYRAVFDTPCIKEDDIKMKEVAYYFVCFVDKLFISAI